jgi:hypothetical protein
MTAPRDGWQAYDDFAGPALDRERWAPARLPMPDGSFHEPLDPNAEMTVADGELRVRIPRFTLSHDTFQPADNVKYLAFSTRQFELPDEGPAAFGVDLVISNVNGDPTDVRSAMAAFNVVDPDGSARVFDVCGTSTRVFAMHEQLPGKTAAAAPFAHAVESPFVDFDDDFTRYRACEITLDKSRSSAEWRVDDQLVYAAHGTFIPDRVRVGFGIFTMVPVRDGASRCLNGQGLDARWRGFGSRGVNA